MWQEYLVERLEQTLIYLNLLAGGMRDNESTSTNSQLQSPPTADLIPHILRSLSKTQPTQQVTEWGAGPQQTSLTPVRWMSKQKATAIGHFTKLTHRGRTPAQVEAATDNDADPEWSSQTAVQTRTNDGSIDSVVADDPGHPGSIAPSTFVKRMQDVLSTIPSFASGISSGPPRSTPTAPQIEVDDTHSPARGPSPLAFLALPNFENGPFEHGWRSFSSALDRLRLPYGKNPETTSPPEPSQNDVLDCIDDNNSIMMYGPLEPDDTSEVEIACSEIVSINGDGEEIRTPQPCFSPLPSESIDEALVGRGLRSPPPRFISLPSESIDEARVGRSPRSPPPHFVPLPLESIDQVLMGGGGEVPNVRWKESESESIPGATSATQVPPTTGPGADQPPVKEYRVWLPSLTKLSVQTMWWGFRM